MEYFTGLELETITIMFDVYEIETVVKNEHGGIEVNTKKGKFELVYFDYAIKNKIDFSKSFKEFVLVKNKG